LNDTFIEASMRGLPARIGARVAFPPDGSEMQCGVPAREILLEPGAQL